MKKNRKLLLLIIIFIITFSCTGCWDRKELDKLSMIKGIAVDPAEETDRIKYTAQIIKHESGGGSGNSLTTSTTQEITSTGYTLFEANRNLIKKIGRTPYYGHTEVILINEKIAKKGINPYLDYFIRNKEIRGRTMILITEGEAKKILETPHILEELSATGIKKMTNGISISGIIVSAELLNLKANLLNKYRDAVASRLELVEKEESKTASNQKKNKNEQNSQEEKIIRANGGAIFKNDEFVSWINRREARGYSWLENPNDVKGPIVIEIPDSSEPNKASIEINNAKGKIVPFYKDNEFIVTIKIDTYGYINENLVQTHNLISEENFNRLNKRYAQTVENEILSAVKISKKYGADILGIGEAIFRKYPEKFNYTAKEWREELKNIDVKIDVRANILRTGMLK